VLFVAGVETVHASNKEHMRLFGDFKLPRKIGTVENVGLQVPVVSPNGARVLYLRTDRETISPLTLLGSPDPADTPREGTLSIWIRPTAGRVSGRKVSQRRWAHSPVWSRSGKSIAYVVNDPPVSFIVHIDLAANRETVLGLPDAVNCMPRFDRDDRTVLFSAAKSWPGPFRVYRQTVGQSDPIALTPEAFDCLLPLATDPAGEVLCAKVQPDQLSWVQCTPSSIIILASAVGLPERTMMPQVWAGIASPLSPDRTSMLFYDTLQNRLCVLDRREHRLSRHRPRSIAACWLSNRAIAVATAENVFAVNTETGLSPQLFDGQWIPCRYVPSTRRLILLGRHSPRRFSIMEIEFKTR